jgi:hypothetical protein
MTSIEASRSISATPQQSAGDYRDLLAATILVELRLEPPPARRTLQSWFAILQHLPEI